MTLSFSFSGGDGIILPCKQQEVNQKAVSPQGNSLYQINFSRVYIGDN